MTIEELSAEELMEETRQVVASEPIQVALNADGEFVVVRATAASRRGASTSHPN